MKDLLLILSIVFSQIAYAQKEIKPGDDASHYMLKIVTSGNTVSEMPIADLKGNVIIMQWWDRNCSGSKEILKSFHAFHKKYRSRIMFYAISNDSWPSIVKFKAKKEYPFDFCTDAAQLENKFFPYTAKAHTVIINRKGVCLYHGSFNLSATILDTLISKDILPIVSQKESKETYEFKQFRNEFEVFRKTIDAYCQTGFKLEPYTASVKQSTWNRSDGKDFYGYNLPIYNIYRDGLLLNDSRILISDSLKKKLSKTDTTHLYLVGFNLRKMNQLSSEKYRKVFKAYLDAAFGLSTKLITQKTDVVLVTKINEGAQIQKTDHIWEHKVRGDTVVLHNYNAQEFVSFLMENYPVIVGNGVINQGRYLMDLVLEKDSMNAEHMMQQLNAQGIRSKLVSKKIRYLEFLPQDAESPVVYLHPKQKENYLKFGYKIGLGKSYNQYENVTYQGKKSFAFNAGLMTQIRLNDHLSIRPEMNYLTSGCKGNFATFRMHCVQIPIQVLFTTSQQKPMGLYVKAGGYYSYHFAGKVEGQSLNFDRDIDIHQYGWLWGLGCWLGNKGYLELSYNHGLSNLLRNSIIGVSNEKSWFLSRVFYF